VVCRGGVYQGSSVVERCLQGGLSRADGPFALPYEVLNALKYSGAFGEDEFKEVAAVLDALQISLYDLEGDYAAKPLK
jgi:hypothetical protein